MSHFLVECASKPINNFTTGYPTNGGAICIPYWNYKKLKVSIKYNGLVDFNVTFTQTNYTDNSTLYNNITRTE